MCDIDERPIWDCQSGSCVIVDCELDEEACLDECNLTSASIIANCGIDGICQEGETITMKGEYEGDCREADFFQIDAVGHPCEINYEESMQGISSVVSGLGKDGGNFSVSWSVPEITAECSGMTVYAGPAALYDGGAPNAQGSDQLDDTDNVSGIFTIETINY